VHPPPELIGASVELGPVELRIPHPLLDAALPGGGGTIVADRSRAVVRVPGVGTFGIDGGTSVRFDPEPDVATGTVGIWLHGTVAALLLGQRGRFALHASVVEVDGQAVALTGPRGAGKSTTALRLSQRGHPLVTDDVTPVDGAAPVTVHPFGRTVRVAPATARDLGIDLDGARPVTPGHPKVELPPPAGPPVALRGIALLEQAAGAGSPVRAVRLRGAAAQRLVWDSAYRVHLLWQLWEAELFAWSSAIAASVPIYAVQRPGDGWTVDAVADAVEQVAAECGDVASPAA
jgi:energy-coupling factor transporter ATP-binding protein EcfA2